MKQVQVLVKYFDIVFGILCICLSRQSYSANFTEKLLLSRNVSPGAYYLHGDLAHAEFDLMELFCAYLDHQDFVPFSCPDMVKAPIVVSLLFK